MHFQEARHSHQARTSAGALVRAGVFSLGLLGLAVAVALAWDTRDETPTERERPWI